MDRGELEHLDTLLHKLREDGQVMEALSVLEQKALVGASEIVRSILGKHVKRESGSSPDSD